MRSRHRATPIVAGLLLGACASATEKGTVGVVRDLAKRRELIHEIQRHVGRQVYRAEAYPIAALAVWEPALRNYVSNPGYDYGDGSLRRPGWITSPAMT